MEPVNSRDELKTPPEGTLFAAAFDKLLSRNGDSYAWLWNKNDGWGDGAVLLAKTIDPLSIGFSVSTLAGCETGRITTGSPSHTVEPLTTVQVGQGLALDGTAANLTGAVIFNFGEGEVARFDKKGFTYRGKLIEDAGEAYNLLMEVMHGIRWGEVEETDTRWREAVIDELVTCGIYSTVHDHEPRKAVHEAIMWNMEMALDPLVSEAADNLLNGWSSWIMKAYISDLESRLNVALCNEQATHEANKRLAHQLFEVEGIKPIYAALEE